ncbi:MAG: hypothetical protein D6B25_07600 [Desulfobulbaceae bacterium]|nr:MAG: hypothetical protein D6B25_07600 [Desulfobulbaceae bacterium]
MSKLTLDGLTTLESRRISVVGGESVEQARERIDDTLRAFVETTTTHQALKNYIRTAHDILLSKNAKRVRSIFPVLIAEECGLDLQECTHYGISIEFLHYASLIHDDVIDEDHERRGIKTLNARFPNSHAVLIGDYMTSVVIEFALEFEHSDKVIRAIVDTSKSLVTGLVIEQTVMPTQASRETYLEMAALKTGSLFELATGLPFINHQNFEKAREFGRIFGILFQVYDDYTDRTTDDRYYNIFHILEEEEISQLWEEYYQRLLYLAKEVGVENVLSVMIKYLQSKGYFQDTLSSGITLFKV